MGPRPNLLTSRRLRPLLLVATGLLLSGAPAFAEEGHGGGHELVLFPKMGELIPLIVLFILLIPLLDKLLFKPLFRVIDARDERIAGARKRAARLEQEAAAVIERYRASIAEVRSESDTERKATLDAARRAQADRISAERADAERRMDAAKVEIDGELTAARQSLRAEVESLAREAAERVLGRAIA